MAAVADWSELPKDILNLISERIEDEIDLIRFRSVCSSWRSSSIPNHHINALPFKLPLLRYYSVNITDPFRSLSKRNIFLIKPPPKQDQTLVHRP
ncbi:F-box protein, partial [Trifolium medium]|nr:F-box protein [Trifolium medium]